MNLIDKDKLGLTDFEIVSCKDYKEVLQKLLNKIDSAEAVDAVPVVRCKDCRHANECHKSVQYTRNEPNTVTIGYSPIEWCSNGKRRDDETN